LRSINGHSQKGGHWGGGALERGHGAPLERLAQLGEALVDAVALPIKTAEMVVRQAATVGSGSVKMGADSARKRTLWGSSAPEMGDHRLLEDVSKRGGALDSDVIVTETARDGWRQ